MKRIVYITSDALCWGAVWGVRTLPAQGSRAAVDWVTDGNDNQRTGWQRNETILTKKNVKNLLEGLAEVAHKELKKSGAFVVPGLAKMVVVKKPATKARKGINPFTKEPTVFKAKPARKVLKIRAVKAAKDALV